MCRFFRSAISGGDSIISPQLPLSPRGERVDNTTQSISLPSPPPTTEGSSILSDTKLLDKLTDVAIVRDAASLRKQRYLQKGREDWRVRTQPVTTEEVDEAIR